MTERPSSPIPVTIITGFLGAGKTTLLNRVLQARHGQRVAVLVNDFGQIDIDTQLLQGASTGEIFSLPNGCICCTLSRNLVQLVQKLLRLPAPPERILIEASGVSTPENIISILDVPDLHHSILLESTVTLLDAENVRRLARAVSFLENQISSADLVLLNKVDLVDREEMEAVVLWVKAIAPDARVVQTTYADVPLELIFGIEEDNPVQPAPLLPAVRPGAVDPQIDHSQVYDTWTYAGQRPLDRARLLNVLSMLPALVYRAKGIVYLADVPDERHILQLVGKRIQISSSGKWGQNQPKTELVFIGGPAALDPLALEASLQSCVV